MLTAGDRNPFLLLFFLVLVTAGRVQSQPPPPQPNNKNSDYNQNGNFNPPMAIVIVVLISAFFFIAFFSIYVRQCSGDDAGGSLRGSPAAAGRSSRRRGLDEQTLESFPTLVYSEVKGLKIGKGALECAVCLGEFEDDETLRLLPKCDHVFHPDCIDAWLSAHVTCPVCRSNLAETPAVGEVQHRAPDEVHRPPYPAAPMTAEHVVTVDPTAEEEEEQANLERIINMKRAKSRGRPVKFPRSHSTGHSLVQPGENLDRFTLRLPESVRRGIMFMDTNGVGPVGNLKRAKSMVGEGSSYRVGEGNTGRAVRSIRLGRSYTWQSMLMKTLSTKMSGWGGKSAGSTTGAT